MENIFDIITKKEFEEIKRELALYDTLREELIKRGREVLKLSKQLIYSVHRNNIDESNNLIKDVKNRKKELDKVLLKHKELVSEPSYSEAIQEYVEAMCYFSFIRYKKLPTREEIVVNAENYLLGICDLTGELVRKAVSLTVKGDFKKVILIKEFVEEVYAFFLEFNLRNGDLRRKSDSIKWNLKKLEEIVYDISLKNVQDRR